MTRSALAGSRRCAPEVTARWKRIYHVRDLEDENIVISFGFFDGSLAGLRELQAQAWRS